MMNATRALTTRRSPKKSACALLTALLVGLLGAAEASAQRRREQRQCYALQVADPASQEQATRGRTRNPKFSASQILDLRFRVLMDSAMSGEHDLELKLYTPKGHLYQTLSATFNAKANNQNGSRRSTRRGRYQVIDKILPVAGTTIVTSSLYGKWNIAVHLDGAPDPCVPPKEFTIDP